MCASGFFTAGARRRGHGCQHGVKGVHWRGYNNPFGIKVKVITLRL